MDVRLNTNINNAINMSLCVFCLIFVNLFNAYDSLIKSLTVQSYLGKLI